MRLLLSLALSVALLAGCGPAWQGAKPITVIGVNPLTKQVEVTNTKDVDVTITNLKSTWTGDGGGSFDVGKVLISDKATPVIEANVAQMAKAIEMQQKVNEAILGTVQELTEMVRIIPWSDILGKYRVPTTQPN